MTRHDTIRSWQFSLPAIFRLQRICLDPPCHFPWNVYRPLNDTFDMQTPDPNTMIDHDWLVLFLCVGYCTRGNGAVWTARLHSRRVRARHHQQSNRIYNGSETCKVIVPLHQRCQRVGTVGEVRWRGGGVHTAVLNDILGKVRYLTCFRKL